MAFIFTPPFEEGDRQVNPDTGVEYCYINGALTAIDKIFLEAEG